MYKWMLTNRYFGSYLRNRRQGRGIPWSVKIATVSLLWIVIGFSAIVVIDNLIVRIVLLVVALGVSIHILTIKAKTI